jgi:hypothetical protein
MTKKVMTSAIEVDRAKNDFLLFSTHLKEVKQIYACLLLKEM